MNSRAYQFQLQAAKAAAEAPQVHAVVDEEPEPPTTKALLLLELAETQGIANAPPAPCQGNGVAPMGVVGNAEPTKCPECPKWFASEKAMFGHLRKHPQRGYKGAIRPATPSDAAAAAAAVAGDKKSKKQEAQKDDGVPAKNMTAAAATVGGKKSWEEAELSTKWPVTAKRGRAPFAPSRGERALEAGKQASSCSEDEEAAMILLGLASSSHSTTSETQQESVQQAVQAPDTASGHQMPDVEEPMVLDHVAGNQMPLEADQQIVQQEIVLEVSAESQTPAVNKEPTNLEITTQAVLVVVPANRSAIAPSPGSSGAGTMKAKKRRAAPDLDQTAASSSPAPPEGADGKLSVWRLPLPASNKKHGCPTCGKTFPTYQALGGHMSSHVKGKTAPLLDDLAAAQARHNIGRLARRSLSGGGFTSAAGGSAAGWGLDLHVKEVQPPAPAVAPSAAPHVCSDCRMTFPTGQALGGHKRKHWFPEKHQAKAAAPVEPAAPAPSPAPSPAEQAAPAAAPAVRDFDLNELPEEGEGENNLP